MRAAAARPLRTTFVALAAVCALGLLVAPAHAGASTGGASADAARGGKLDPKRSGALAYGVPTRQRPVARVFQVTPRSVVQGRRPTLRVRIDQRGVRTVTARVVAIDPKSKRVGARFDLGRMSTGRVRAIRWPARHLPPAGDYEVRLHAKDPQGATLARAASTSGKTRLTVRPRPRPETSQPEPPEQPTPVARAGGIFPLAGSSWSFGGAGGRFGATRGTHMHEGQDIAAPAGTPVLAPVPGTIAFVNYQASGAGWYVVLNADDGRSMFFAHLQTSSIPVRPGERVTAGQAIGRVGTTGSSSGPHLHFEIWIGGWRDRGGTPIDPLPQLRAWAG
jgi:hypothetical protein